MPLIRDIINVLETAAPLHLQESYDNAGLACGNQDMECSGALVALDLTMEVISEAILLKKNLIITHHPPVFKGLKQLVSGNVVSDLMIACIKNDINVYSSHTNLDNVLHGVNGEIAARLNLQKTRVLQPLPGTHRQLAVFVPEKHEESVKAAMFSSGAGTVGRYDECSFSTAGTGTFRPLEGSNPFSGALDIRSHEQEVRLEFIYPVHLENRILQALQTAHPYETVAYSLYPIENKFGELGAGIIGELNEPVTVQHFFEQVKTKFQTGVIRHSEIFKTTVKTIAICGGSGKSLIINALKNKADLFLTADLGYHDFFLGNKQMILADIGHFESEQFTSDLILRLINEKIPTFAVQKAASKTNPVNYFL
jgi:dinuclear metal center YbgI/SA1388 family protein